MRRRILIVDDNRGLLESLIELLERQGYWPEPADDLGLARTLYSRQRPDLVLLDCDVRGGDGLELMDDFRREPPAPPVIVMTARNDVHTSTRCRQLGARSLLNKPFPMEQLIDEIRRILLVRTLLITGSTISLKLLAHQIEQERGRREQTEDRKIEDRSQKPEFRSRRPEAGGQKTEE